MCFNPEIAFGDLEKFSKSIILTSGTLSPLKSFESSLNTCFLYELEASNVMKSNQFPSLAVASYKNTRLDNTYKNTSIYTLY